MIRRLVTLTLISAFLTVCYADSLEDLRASLTAKKRDLIATELGLSEDNTAFWEVYDKYQQKQSKHSTAALKLIREFNDKYAKGDIDPQSMVNMQAEFFRIEGRALQTKQNYSKHFTQILSSEDIFRFFQLDKKIDALIRSKIAQQMPIFAEQVNLD